MNVYHRVDFDSLPHLVALNKAICDPLYFWPSTTLYTLTGPRPCMVAGFLVLSLVDPIRSRVCLQCATMGGVRHGRVRDPEIARHLSCHSHWSRLAAQQTTTGASGQSWVVESFGFGQNIDATCM